jgi:preprotein translocase subunit SecB
MRRLQLASRKKSLAVVQESALDKHEETDQTSSTDVAVHPRIAFIKSVRLLGVGLDRSTSFLDRDSHAAFLKKAGQLDTEVRAHQHVITHLEKYFVIGADFEITQTAKAENKVLLSISASFSARFDLTEPALQDFVNAFAKLEARLIFFPYLRHFISDMTYRMSIDPIVLPLTSELEQQGSVIARK